jgi:hypothetical protein
MDLLWISQEFLTSTTPPRTDTYPHQWHPDFDLESVPHIEEAEVPLLKPKVIDASNLDLRILGSRKELQQPLSKETSSKETSSKETLSKVTLSSSSSSSATTSNTEEKSPSTTEHVVANVTPESSALKDLSSLERLKEQVWCRHVFQNLHESSTSTLYARLTNRNLNV